MKCFILPLILSLDLAAARVFTGFNYGAFWSEQSNVKRYADFHHGFELAQNLTTPVPFDSARLYTCITTGTQSDPTEAFQAAIDTGTNLLLGMWISPGVTGQSNAAQVDNELAALEKAFEQHGQKLADLIIGLSVGNEDVYRSHTEAAGVGSDDLLLTIKKVRDSIAASPYAKYMQGKPIGHSDTAMYAVVPTSDFIGMTAYPYWNDESIENANRSFMATLKDTQQRAGNISVWIAEMGWPLNGTQKGEAVASAENYQRYWDEVGCQVFGKYNTFWFELLQDSQPDQPDWGLLDTKTYQPRIRDLSCGHMRNMTAPTVGQPPTDSSLAASNPTTFSTIFSTDSNSASPTPPPSEQPANTIVTSTTHTTTTSTNTPPPPASAEVFTLYMTTTPSPNSTLTLCTTMLDLLGNGVFFPVASAPLSGTLPCAPPPRFAGPAFRVIDAPVSTVPASGVTTVPASSTTNAAVGASTESPTSTTTEAPTSADAAPAAQTTCVTAGNFVYKARVSDGSTWLLEPTPDCSGGAGGGPAVSGPAVSALNGRAALS